MFEHNAAPVMILSLSCLFCCFLWSLCSSTPPKLAFPSTPPISLLSIHLGPPPVYPVLIHDSTNWPVMYSADKLYEVTFNLLCSCNDWKFTSSSEDRQATLAHQEATSKPWLRELLPGWVEDFFNTVESQPSPHSASFGPARLQSAIRTSHNQPALQSQIREPAACLSWAG